MFIQGGGKNGGGHHSFLREEKMASSGGRGFRARSQRVRLDVVRTGRVAPVWFLPSDCVMVGGQDRESGRGFRGECHWGAPTAVGTGGLRALVAAERTGEPVRGPRAVEAGKAEIPVIMLAVLTAGFPLGMLADPATRD